MQCALFRRECKLARIQKFKNSENVGDHKLTRDLYLTLTNRRLAHDSTLTNHMTWPWPLETGCQVVFNISAQGSAETFKCLRDVMATAGVAHPSFSNSNCKVNRTDGGSPDAELQPRFKNSLRVRTVHRKNSHVEAGLLFKNTRGTSTVENTQNSMNNFVVLNATISDD